MTFLGFSFRSQKSKKGKPCVHIEPSPAAEQALRDRVREMTCRGTTWRDPAAVVREINLTTRGWGNYFAQHHYRQSFRQMNHYVGHRLRQWLWRKHGNPWGKYERWTDRILRTTYQLHDLPH